jgi:hypothetical protein
VGVRRTAVVRAVAFVYASVVGLTLASIASVITTVYMVVDLLTRVVVGRQVFSATAVWVSIPRQVITWAYGQYYWAISGDGYGAGQFRPYPDFDL